MLNQTAIYAIRAMGFLAQQEPGEFVLTSTVASAMSIPRNFLSKILNRLAQTGLIVATRGRGGGVKLARPAMEIPIDDVARLFMKATDYNQCLLRMRTCDSRCGLHRRWRSITKQFEQMLVDTTLDQVF